MGEEMGIRRVECVNSAMSASCMVPERFEVLAIYLMTIFKQDLIPKPAIILPWGLDLVIRRKAIMAHGPPRTPLKAQHCFPQIRAWLSL